MQPATTFTIASVGASIVGSGTSSERRMSRGAWMVVARIRRSLHAVREAPVSPADPSGAGRLLLYLISEIPWPA